jgi:hypothetical protein
MGFHGFNMAWNLRGEDLGEQQWAGIKPSLSKETMYVFDQVCMATRSCNTFLNVPMSILTLASSMLLHNLINAAVFADL